MPLYGEKGTGGSPFCYVGCSSIQLVIRKMMVMAIVHCCVYRELVIPIHYFMVVDDDK